VCTAGKGMKEVENHFEVRLFFTVHILFCSTTFFQSLVFVVSKFVLYIYFHPLFYINLYNYHLLFSLPNNNMLNIICQLQFLKIDNLFYFSLFSFLSAPIPFFFSLFTFFFLFPFLFLFLSLPFPFYFSSFLLFLWHFLFLPYKKLIPILVLSSGVARIGGREGVRWVTSMRQ
jgi:hypothetical protein